MDDTLDIELVEFKITLDSIWHNDPPKYEILLNDNLIDSGVVTEKEESGEGKIITFSSELPEGEHVIKIRLLDKQNKHTPIDENNNILADQLLNIKQVEIDEIELDHLFYELGTYHRQVDAQNGSPIYSETPLPENYKNLGWNGEWRLKFSVPTYIWFLENL
jgi:hypothetical protein